MRIRKTVFENVKVIDAHEFVDSRGTFKKIFDSDRVEQIIQHDFRIKQVNISQNTRKGTVRGMHLQNKPFGESKIVFCSKGSVNDVVVDMRKESSTYLQAFNFILNEHDQNLIYIPNGFAHGYQSLVDNTELIYLSNNVYNKMYESGLNPLDPIVEPQWTIPISELSERDQKLPRVTVIK